MSTSKPVLPYIALGFGVLALSLSSLFIHWAQAPGLVTSFYRMAIATVLLAPVVWRSWRKSGLPDRAWLLFPVLGGLFTALDHGTWSTAIGFTRIANATLLNNIAPLWVALFAVLIWRERLSKRFWLGLVISLLGAGVVLGMDLVFAPQMTLGNLLAVFSSLFYAGYFLITQKGRSRLDALSYIWLVDLFCTLFLLGISQVFQMPLGGYNTTTWIVFFAAAVISQVGGYFSIAYALGHLPASIVSPTMVLQPVITALLAIPFTGETLSPLQWVGALAVVGGVYVVNISQAKGK
jgi:drug/metabolite transporter (DMT)-like permease